MLNTWFILPNHVHDVKLYVTIHSPFIYVTVVSVSLQSCDNALFLEMWTVPLPEILKLCHWKWEYDREFPIHNMNEWTLNMDMIWSPSEYCTNLLIIPPQRSCRGYTGSPCPSVCRQILCKYWNYVIENESMTANSRYIIWMNEH
jgi:hypothetical protein